eukprot:176295-Rhodomonas_salina.1
MALCLNFVSSLSAIFGAFVLLGIDEITVDVDHTMGILLGMGAGLMLYIATSLIPGIVAVEDFSKARLCWLVRSLAARESNGIFKLFSVGTMPRLLDDGATVTLPLHNDHHDTMTLACCQCCCSMMVP